MQILSPSVVLAAYAEPLFDGRRVVVFGDATSAVAEELVQRGARTVHVYDAEPSRAAVAAGRNASRQIVVAPLDDTDLAVRDGAYDVALVENLGSFAEPRVLLRRLRRAVSSRGVAIIASPNPEASGALLPPTSGARSASELGYYELYDAVSAEFAEVRMLGQTPFVGYAVVDFAPDGEPEVSIDSGLVPGGSEEPEWFVALASRERVDCDPVGIVQLPARSVIGDGASGALSEELRTARSSEARLLDRVAELEVELAEVREQTLAAPVDTGRLEAEISRRDAAIADLTARLAAADARDAALGEQLAELKRGESTREQVLRTAAEQHLEAQVASYKQHAANIEAELVARKQELSEMLVQLSELSEKNGELTERNTRTEAERAAEIAAERQKLAAAEAELARQKAEDEVPRELAALEATLQERGEHIRSLSEQLREAERVGRELLRELGHGPGAPARASELEHMTAENARLTANLEALSWTVQELEGRLASPVER